MQEIDLGIQHTQNTIPETVEQKGPLVTVVFDEKVRWADLPFAVIVDSQRLTSFMRHTGMDDEEIGKHKLHLHWSKGRTFLASYYDRDKEISMNINLFSDNKGKNNLSELRPSAEELNAVEDTLNHNLHHEIGHAVEPEELKKGWIRRTVMMFVGSLTLPEAAFLLKEMSISRPSFSEASTVAWVSFSLLGLSLVWRNAADPAEIYAQQFADEQQKDDRWKSIIKFSPKEQISD